MILARKRGKGAARNPSSNVSCRPLHTSELVKHNPQIQPHATSSFFSKTSKVLSGCRNKSRQALGSAVSLYLNQRNVTHFRKDSEIDIICLTPRRIKKNCSFHYLSRMVLRYRTIHINYRTTVVFSLLVAHAAPYLNKKVLKSMNCNLPKCLGSSAVS